IATAAGSFPQLRQQSGETIATKTYPQIPCEVCGHPRTFLAGLQWCSNCGWNRQTALSGLRRRSRIMTLVAACIVILNLLLFCAIPQIGILYLPLFGFLAAAIAIIPYREYRQVQQVIERANIHPSPELVMINLRNLKPQLRVSALLLLGLALATG